MKIFSTLKKQATSFLGQYQQENPATYAAAEQAVGAILITDGFIGIDNPFGGKKRPGIFGTVVGMVMGVVFMLIPTFFGNLTNINNMTSVTSATVVSVGQSSTSTRVNTGSNRSSSAPSCSLSVKYSVDGKEYTKQSPISSGSYCSLTEGQTVNINYDPNNPDSWAYGTKTMTSVLWIFFIVGIFMLISSIVTFIIRLFSIIFGWKLVKKGRKDAANLPQSTNLETIVEEIKQNFTKTVFNFGGASGFSSGITGPAQNMVNNQPPTASTPQTQPSAQQGTPTQNPLSGIPNNVTPQPQPPQTTTPDENTPQGQ